MLIVTLTSFAPLFGGSVPPRLQAATANAAPTTTHRLNRLVRFDIGYSPPLRCLAAANTTGGDDTEGRDLPDPHRNTVDVFRTRGGEVAEFGGPSAGAKDSTCAWGAAAGTGEPRRLMACRAARSRSRRRRPSSRFIQRIIEVTKTTAITPTTTARATPARIGGVDRPFRVRNAAAMLAMSVAAEPSRRPLEKVPMNTPCM
ncbi:hypothetical protein [Mycobacterium kiyosense]|uniref:hypothetical protein n=1 Tax=Mycobacterium kiyosense TaxID=2871094 RepID=UPI00222F11EB|nr:hypothetical protein [Mycobacterium kiyosense]